MIDNARMTEPLPPAATVKPFPTTPATLPSSTISGGVFGAATYPGWVVPSIVTGPVMSGSEVWRAMIFGPTSGTEMLKEIVCAPACAFALRIAWRSDPAPASAVVVTTVDPPPPPAVSVRTRAGRNSGRVAFSLET